MRTIEEQIKTLGESAKRALLQTQNKVGAPLPVGTSAIVQHELTMAGAVGRLGLITYRGLALRDLVLEAALDAIDPPAADPQDGVTAAQLVELMAAAQAWLEHLTYKEHDLLTEQGEQTPTGRLYLAIKALG